MRQPSDEATPASPPQHGTGRRLLRAARNGRTFLPIADMMLADATATLPVPPGQGMRTAFAAIDDGRVNASAGVAVEVA